MKQNRKIRCKRTLKQRVKGKDTKEEKKRRRLVRKKGDEEWNRVEKNLSKFQKRRFKESCKIIEERCLLEIKNRKTRGMEISEGNI